MSDLPTYRAVPDPEFAGRLEHLLLQRLAETAVPSDARPSLHSDEPAKNAALELPGREAPPRTRRPALAVAAVVLSVVAAGLFMTRDRDEGTGLTTSPEPTELFADLPAGGSVALPAGPGSARHDRGIWTGTELIVWGEPAAPDASPAPSGAALDPASDTWRTIAAAPITTGSPVAWTGEEMIVWGGSTGEGAAYDPDADEWRVLADAPIPLTDAIAVWTGEIVIALDGGDNLLRAAAYDPATDEWRALADADGYLASDAVWTGTAVLAVLDVGGPADRGQGDGAGLRLARYDLGTDTWHLDAGGRYVGLVGIPDADGASRSVLGMPIEAGAPVQLLDSAGNPTRALTAHPADLGGSTTAAGGIWVGEEAVFWIRAADQVLLPSPEAWALNPDTGTWRPLPDELSSLVNDGANPVAVGDVLLLWDRTQGLAYRTLP